MIRGSIRSICLCAAMRSMTELLYAYNIGASAPAEDVLSRSNCPFECSINCDG